MKSSEAIRIRQLKSIQVGVLALAVAATGIGGWAVAQDKEKISKFLLLKLSRDQSQVLCTAEAFTSCMGFSEQVCFEVSEKALEQCIAPLPLPACKKHPTTNFRRPECQSASQVLMVGVNGEPGDNHCVR